MAVGSPFKSLALSTRTPNEIANCCSLASAKLSGSPIASNTLNDRGYIDVSFTVKVAEGFLPGDVEQAVLERLSAGRMRDGRLGFFHPDRFTFGERVYLSQLLGAVGEVPGVAWVDLGSKPSSGHRFDRLFDPTGDAIDEGYIEIDRLEIVRLDAGPDHPDRGRLELIIEEAS